MRSSLGASFTQEKPKRPRNEGIEIVASQRVLVTNKIVPHRSSDGFLAAKNQINGILADKSFQQLSMKAIPIVSSSNLKRPQSRNYNQKY